MSESDVVPGALTSGVVATVSTTDAGAAAVLGPVGDTPEDTSSTGSAGSSAVRPVDGSGPGVGGEEVGAVSPAEPCGGWGAVAGVSAPEVRGGGDSVREVSAGALGGEAVEVEGRFVRVARLGCTAVGAAVDVGSSIGVAWAASFVVGALVRTVSTAGFVVAVGVDSERLVGAAVADRLAVPAVVAVGRLLVGVATVEGSVAGAAAFDASGVTASNVGRTRAT